MSTFTERVRVALSRLRQTAGAMILLALAAAPMAARADTVASLLGDFTINQYCGVQLADDSVKLHLVIVFGQLPALRELHQADANGDGVTTEQERDAYVSTLAPGFAKQLALTVDGAPIALRATGWTSSLPKEQSGFSLRVDIDYVGDLPGSSGPATRSMTLANQIFPGRIGWHEIAVSPAAGLQVFDTNAFSTSMTGRLTEALQALPTNGPLDEREVHLRFVRGFAPTGSRLQAARDGTAQSPQAGASAAPTPTDTAWLSVQTRRLVDLISTPNVPVHIRVLALLAAMVLGALHALSPGHGKSIVGAYLVGSRGTPRHAVFLGVTVTVTHTLVVFALGLATLFASQFILPERVFPILSLLSGLLVLGMGLVLLAQRWKVARVNWLWGRAEAPAVPHPADDLMFSPALPGDHHHGGAFDHCHDGRTPHAHSHSHPHPHAHVHASESMPAGHSAHSHTHSPGLTHSHGGTVHSHAPVGADGQAVSWRGLLALGVSGGLLPCPSAMVLLLAAVALNKTVFGLLLVVAFSVGLAATLIAVGLMFLYARNRFQSRIKSSRWPHVLPVLSAASITFLGAALCVGTLVSNPL
jgi:nickel/cobalt exporter